MSLIESLWPAFFSIIFLLELIGPAQTLAHSDFDDGHKDLEWFKLKCFQGREPLPDTVDELHAQVFAGKSQIYEDKRHVAVYLSQYWAFGDAKDADILCTSRGIADNVVPTRIACPFETGSQNEIQTEWSFVPKKTKGDTSPKPQTPAVRSLQNYLFIDNLTENDEGQYLCKATRRQMTWIEQWSIYRESDSWILSWHNENGDVKAYRMRNSSIAIIPVVHESWLYDQLLSAGNHDRY